jgi:cell division GTPase FtsZ
MQNQINKFKLINDTEEQREMLQELFSQNLENENNINITAEHLEEVLSKGNLVEIITSEVTSDTKMMKLSIESIVNSMNSLENVKAVVLKFTVNPNIQAMELFKAITLLESLIEQKILIVFGTQTDSILAKDYIHTDAMIIYEEIN